jgi:hypothetical protein
VLRQLNHVELVSQVSDLSTVKVNGIQRGKSRSISLIGVVLTGPRGCLLTEGQVGRYMECWDGAIVLFRVYLVTLSIIPDGHHIIMDGGGVFSRLVHFASRWLLGMDFLDFSGLGVCMR